MIKSSILYRISSGLLLFFAATHTYGMFNPAAAPAAEASAAVMKTIHFNVMGWRRTYWDFYFGFGLLLSVFLIFSAVLAWQMGSVRDDERKFVKTLAWPFAAAHTAAAVLCWLYFFPAPGIVSTITAACLLAAAVKLR